LADILVVEDLPAASAFYSNQKIVQEKIGANIKDIKHMLVNP
jgi:hypothetical protein